jgi:hypothetical protein
MPKKATTAKEQPEVHAEAAKTIHVRAAGELLLLEQRLAEIGQEGSAAQVELAEIEPARQKRQSELVAARNAKERTASEEKRATKYAQLSIGTSRESSAVKRLSSAQRAAIEAEKALKALEPTTLEAEQKAEKRQAELIKQLSELADEKGSVIDEIQQAKELHEETRKELGMQKYAEIVKIDNEQHKGPIDALKNQIVARQVARHNFLEKAKDELEEGEWWDLSNRLDRELLQPDDDEDDYDD